MFLIFSQVPDPACHCRQNERTEAIEAFRGSIASTSPWDSATSASSASFRPSAPQKVAGGASNSRARNELLEDVLWLMRWEALPATMLAFAAMGLALVLGILLGLMLAWRGDGPGARAIIGFATLGMSAPSFFVAILVAWGFGVVWHDVTGLPATGGWRVLDPFEGPQVAWKHLILPALTLGIRPLSVVIQLTRNAAADVLEESYVRTARAKGLGGWQLLRRHVVRNAMNPVLTAASGWFASMLAGAVFVEYVFGWNGMGLLMFRALEQGDLPVVMGGVLVVAAVFVAVNILVDVMYSWLDPRVRLD